MNARRDSADEPEAGSSGGRALLVGAVLFAAAATGLLVLSDQEKWLRLGIVAALWAALVGAFLAAKYRRQLADQRDVAADRQQIYELELEREVAARREYELEVAAESKRQAEEESRDDIAALRGELSTLRQTLESLLGGEFLVERYALRAESTRMRSLPEDRSLARNDLKRLPPAQPRPEDAIPSIVREAETDLIERIREVHHKPAREPAREPHRPEPRVERSDVRSPSLPRRAERPSRTEWPTPEPVRPLKRAEPVQPARMVEHPAEMSDRWFMPEGIGDGTPPPQSRRPQPQAVEPEWQHTRAAHDDGRRSRHVEPAELAEPPGRSYDRDPSMPFGTTAEQTSWLAQYNKPHTEEPTYTSRAYVPPARVDPPSTPEPTLTDRPSRRSAEYTGHHAPVQDVPDPPSGRRHRAEPADAPAESGGRRRRAEGQPSWQETVGRNGHAQPDAPSGSHAAGRSVNELLANHGVEGGPRRRRRREE